METCEKCKFWTSEGIGVQGNCNELSAELMVVQEGEVLENCNIKTTYNFYCKWFESIYYTEPVIV